MRRSGNRIRVTAQLISADNGSHLFSERYDREMADVFALQDELAAAITAALKVKLSGQPEHRHYTPSLPAYDAVLKARHYFYQLTPDGMARAQEYLRQAIALDPGYAAPHSELGLVFNALANFGITPAHDVIPLARAEARRALEMDPSQADALTLLGYIAANYDYDWKEAQRLFGLAREHGQISPIARSRYARYLGALGRPAEDVEECERVLADDPLSSYFRTMLAYGLIEVGRYEDAVQECRRVLELDENYYMSWVHLSVAAWGQGRVERALSAVERAVSLAPWNLVSQGMLAGLRGLAADEVGAAAALRKLGDRKSTRLNSSHHAISRMPSSA